MPLIAEANNARHGFAGESLRVLNMLSDKVPEAGLIATDLDFTTLSVVGTSDLKNALACDTDYLVRCYAANGTEYILPSEKLLKSLESLGYDLDSFYGRLADMSTDPETKFPEYRSTKGYEYIVYTLMNNEDFGKTKSPETHKADPIPCTIQDMTADEFMFCLSVAATMLLADQIGNDAAAQEKYQKIMSNLLSEMDLLESEIEAAGNVEML